MEKVQQSHVCNATHVQTAWHVVPAPNRWIHDHTHKSIDPIRPEDSMGRDEGIDTSKSNRRWRRDPGEKRSQNDRQKTVSATVHVRSRRGGAVSRRTRVAGFPSHAIQRTSHVRRTGARRRSGPTVTVAMRLAARMRIGATCVHGVVPKNLATSVQSLLGRHPLSTREQTRSKGGVETGIDPNRPVIQTSNSAHCSTGSRWIGSRQGSCPARWNGWEVKLTWVQGKCTL